MTAISLERADHRRLGVAVAELRADGKAIALDDPRLAAGWHELEADAENTWRWTDSDALLAVQGVRILEIETCLAERYWVGRRGLAGRAA
jgi:hypothetical protein